MRNPTRAQVDELREVAQSFVSSSPTWAMVCDVLDAYVRLIDGWTALEDRVRELAQPCIACGHKPGNTPTEELPLVKGALDAQAKAESELFKLRAENAVLRQERDDARRSHCIVASSYRRSCGEEVTVRDCAKGRYPDDVDTLFPENP